MRVWELLVDSQKALVLRSDLDSLEGHFVGKPLGGRWKPPKIEILGKSRHLRDFVSWTLEAPVVSERALMLLNPVLQESCEFLPLIRLRGEQYFAVNVLEIVDCLDEAASDLWRSPTDPKHIIGAGSFVFNERRLKAVPVFKIPQYLLAVFVTASFVDAVRRSPLTGAIFSDPGQNKLGMLAAGKGLSYFPEQK